MQIRNPNKLDWIIILVLGIISFLIYGAPFYPYLDSDMAVHVYMTADFDITENLYFWNQDRLGSIVPMIGHVIYSLSPLNAIWSCGLAEYLILIFGCYAFSFFTQNSFQTFLLSLVWFLPSKEMAYQILISQPYGEQLSFIGISLVLFHKIITDQRYILFPFFILSTIISLWISDFSVVYYFFLILLFPIKIWSALKDLVQLENYRWLMIGTSTLIGGVLFLNYAKNHTPKDETYVSKMFSNSEEIGITLDHIWRYTCDVLFFESNNLLDSIIIYSVISCLVLLIFNKLKMQGFQNKWTNYFLISSILSFSLLLPVRWIAINYVMLKYFLPAFYFLWIGLIINQYRFTKYLKVVYTFLITAAIGLSSITGFQEIIESNNLGNSYQEIKGLQKITKYGIIGDYWNSYKLGLAYPETVHSTPHSPYLHRNKIMVERTFSQDTIALVQNNWLEEGFPDTIKLYNYHLKCTGNEDEELGFRFKRYVVYQTD